MDKALTGRTWGAIAVAAGLAWPISAAALDIELRDVAPDRLERQRAYGRGEVPFVGTPDLKSLDQRLAAKGLSRGRPIFIRIFKATSELEIWMQKGETFVLLDTYPVCHWTGTLGPKLKEGDKQSPEGFYSIVNRQMRLVGRWQRAFNIGFPNLHDQLNKRTGSFILVHGGCSSVGCFAMTEQVQEEVFALADAAVKAGQQRFHVHIFPFRMTDAAMDAFAEHTWAPFWRELKAGYDSFERTHVPPRVALCESRYTVADGEAGEIGDQKPLSIVPPVINAATGGAPVCVLKPDRPISAAVLPPARDADAGDTTARRVRPRAAPSSVSAASPDGAPAAGSPPQGFGDPAVKSAPKVVYSGG